MYRQITILLAVILIMGGAGQAVASGSWWQLCDSCTEESHFQYQALNAPGSYTPIYVTNRDTNVTRKYNRFTSTEDMDGTLVQWTEVSPADFPAAEKDVFDQVVEGAQRINIDVPRSYLDLGDTPGLGRDSGSVVGDISDGEISTALVAAAIKYLERRNVMPMHEAVNEQAGLDLAGANYSGSRTTIRKYDLFVKLTYSDGSGIQFTWHPDGTITGWIAIDADGNRIPLEAVDGDGPIPVNAGRFDDRDVRFGAANGANAEALATRINEMTGGSLQCTSSETSDRVIVSCTKIK